MWKAALLIASLVEMIYAYTPITEGSRSDSWQWNFVSPMTFLTLHVVILAFTIILSPGASGDNHAGDFSSEVLPGDGSLIHFATCHPKLSLITSKLYMQVHTCFYESAHKICNALQRLGVVTGGSAKVLLEWTFRAHGARTCSFERSLAWEMFKKYFMQKIARESEL